MLESRKQKIIYKIELAHISPRAQEIVDHVINKQRNLKSAKIQPHFKRYFKDRAHEILVELNDKDSKENIFILKEKTFEAQLAFLKNPTVKRNLEVLILLPKKVFIIASEEKLTAGKIRSHCNSRPVIQKKQAGDKLIFTLHYIDFDNRAKVPKLCSYQINSKAIKKTDFEDKFKKNFSSIELSLSTRESILNNCSMLGSQKSLISGANFKFNSALFSVGVVFLLEINACQIDLLRPSKQDGLEHKDQGFNALKRCRFNGAITSTVSNQPSYFRSSQPYAGMLASQAYTFLARMKVKIHVSTRQSAFPSPTEILHGHNDSKESTLLSVMLYQTLYKKITTEKSTLLEGISRGIERFHAARTFRPAIVREIMEFIKSSDPTNLVQDVLDPCGGWGDRLVAFLSDPHVKTITINDANSEMKKDYEDIVKAYNSDKKVDLIASPFESFPQDVLVKKSNSMDLILTSPPYFFKERYSGDKSSHVLYTDYQSWFQNFLVATFAKSFIMLKENGYIVMCVANFNGYKVHYDLADKTLELMKQVCSSTFSLNYNHSVNGPNGGKSATPLLDNSEMIFIGKINKAANPEKVFLDVKEIKINKNKKLPLKCDEEDLDLTKNKEFKKHILNTKSVDKDLSKAKSTKKNKSSLLDQTIPLKKVKKMPSLPIIQANFKKSLIEKLNDQNFILRCEATYSALFGLRISMRFSENCELTDTIIETLMKILNVPAPDITNILDKNRYNGKMYVLNKNILMDYFAQAFSQQNIFSGNATLASQILVILSVSAIYSYSDNAIVLNNICELLSSPSLIKQGGPLSTLDFHPTLSFAAMPETQMELSPLPLLPIPQPIAPFIPISDFSMDLPFDFNINIPYLESSVAAKPVEGFLISDEQKNLTQFKFATSYGEKDVINFISEESFFKKYKATYTSYFKGHIQSSNQDNPRAVLKLIMDLSKITNIPLDKMIYVLSSGNVENDIPYTLPSHQLESYFRSKRVERYQPYSKIVIKARKVLSILLASQLFKNNEVLLKKCVSYLSKPSPIPTTEHRAAISTEPSSFEQPDPLGFQVDTTIDWSKIVIPAALSAPVLPSTLSESLSLPVSEPLPEAGLSATGLTTFGLFSSIDKTSPLPESYPFKKSL